MLVVIGLLFVAALAGFLVGRESVDDDSPAAAQTETQGETTESEPATTEAATTEATETEGEEADGAAVFAEAGCGGCHVFAPANSNGTVGPPLDGIDLSKDEIVQQVRNGGGGMPAFGDQLSAQELADVSAYVVKDLAAK